ncbi:MAG: hypothetical protein JWQ94_1912 [Tardiphaga sp.]|nr:hypothetical protein [Tardiphaga sp.]
MDSLHHMLRGLRTETKAQPGHLDVFREFLARLDELQRQALPRRREPPRRKPPKRAKAG